jgi:SAM-dependent methyltransferase
MKKADDFDWEKYTEVSYLKEIENMQKDNYDFKVEKSYVENNKLILKDNLHPNWAAIYSTIIETKVSSVYEAGCGAGYHLYNIKKLLPDIKIGGCDISMNQIDEPSKVLKIPKRILSCIDILDFSQYNLDKDFPKRSYDFVFSHAVTMHLEHERAISFIYTMKELSKKYVMLIENQSYEHDYKELLKQSTILDEFNLIDMSYKNVEAIFLERK